MHGVGKVYWPLGSNDRLSQLADHALHKLVVEDSVAVYTVDGILNDTEDLTWVLPPWLHTSGQLILSSAPGVGKTQIAFQVAYSILEETRFLGMKSETSITHSILFMSLEMDKRSLKVYFVSPTKGMDAESKPLIYSGRAYEPDNVREPDRREADNSTDC